MLLRATAARHTVGPRRTKRLRYRSIFSANTSAPKDGRFAVNDLSRPERVAAGAIGQALPRKEDVRLLTGAGRFSDDFNLEAQAYAAMVRSPHPHARILGVDPTRSQEERPRYGTRCPTTCWWTRASVTRGRPIAPSPKPIASSG